MQIVTSIEQFGDLKNMLVEDVVSRLKVQEERLRCYEDKEKKKHLLLTHEEILARTKRKDAADSSASCTNGHGDHNKECRGHGLAAVMGADVVVEEVVTIPHKPMTMPTPGRTRV